MACRSLKFGFSEFHSSFAALDNVVTVKGQNAGRKQPGNLICHQQRRKKDWRAQAINF